MLSSHGKKYFASCDLINICSEENISSIWDRDIKKSKLFLHLLQLFVSGIQIC